MNTIDQDLKMFLPNGSLLVFLGIVGGLVFWFAMLYPLIPRTPMGWFVGVVAGVLIGLWAVASAFAINWLGQKRRFWLLCRAAAVVIALSLGVGIFWVALNAQAYMTANFSYFGR